jgi:uncharacterized membrane protein (UPF0127 family)
MGFVAVIAAHGAACGRIDEPPPSRPAQTTARPATSAQTVPTDPRPHPIRSAPAQPTATPAASCVVPTPEKPPPRALPAARCPPDPGAIPELPRASLVFVDAPGAPRIRVERALTDAHRSRGLMYRTSMPKDHGMLFSWEAEQVQSFWMRNTCIPLDMLFVTKDGTIAGILEQVPTLNEAPRSIACPVAHVLEVNAGYCRANGVRAGQRVSIE